MRRLTVLVLVALLCLGADACGASTSSDGTSSGTLPTSIQTTAIGSPTQRTSDVVNWSEASSRIGESVTVEGPVMGTHYAENSNGSPTFLNVGADYPDESRFTVVIWGEDRGNFPEAPEDRYAGQTIRVTGTVSDYQGVSEIEVASPDDIEIVQ